MTKKHTAESLRFYFGKMVCCLNPVSYSCGQIRCIDLDEDFPIGIYIGADEFERFNPEFVYPILKTVNSMTKEELNSVFCIDDINAIEHISETNDKEWKFFVKTFNRSDFRIVFQYDDEKKSYFIKNDFQCDLFDINRMLRLFRTDFGAIPDKNSPTGYSDLFGMPCVTPKQVDGMAS